jgi:hypothetical protein
MQSIEAPPACEMEPPLNVSCRGRLGCWAAASRAAGSPQNFRPDNEVEIVGNADGSSQFLWGGGDGSKAQSGFCFDGMDDLQHLQRRF